MIEHRSDHDYNEATQTCTPTNDKRPFGWCHQCNAALYLKGTPSGDYCMCPNGCLDPYGFEGTGALSPPPRG